jgi:hypothetical protein
LFLLRDGVLADGDSGELEVIRKEIDVRSGTPQDAEGFRQHLGPLEWAGRSLETLVDTRCGGQQAVAHEMEAKVLHLAPGSPAAACAS